MVLNMIITKRKKFLISWDVNYLIQYILSVFETFSFFENVIMEPHCADVLKNNIYLSLDIVSV